MLMMILLLDLDLLRLTDCGELEFDWCVLMMSCVFILILLVDWIVSFGFWGCFVVGIC